MNEVKILQGSTSFVYEGITNLQELKVFAEEKASRYKNIVVTDENVKECETQRQLKISNKKALFSDRINSINTDLELVNQNLFFAKIDLVEFKDEWANKKDKDIEVIIDTEVNNKNNQVKALTERLENVKTYCELLKSQYDLKTNVSWEYLRERVYLDNYKELLEDMAQMQVEKEIEIIEKHEEVKELEKEVVKEVIVEKIAKEDLKEFKVRIDCVLEGISEEEIQERILKMFATDKIKVSFK